MKHFHDLAGQRLDALFVALAQNVELRIGQFQTFELERPDLAGTQAIE